MAASSVADYWHVSQVHQLCSRCFVGDLEDDVVEVLQVLALVDGGGCTIRNSRCSMMHQQCAMLVANNGSSELIEPWVIDGSGIIVVACTAAMLCCECMDYWIVALLL